MLPLPLCGGRADSSSPLENEHQWGSQTFDNIEYPFEIGLAIPSGEIGYSFEIGVVTPMIRLSMPLSEFQSVVLWLRPKQTLAEGALKISWLVNSAQTWPQTCLEIKWLVMKTTGIVILDLLRPKLWKKPWKGMSQVATWLSELFCYFFFFMFW